MPRFPPNDIHLIDCKKFKFQLVHTFKGFEISSFGNDGRYLLQCNCSMTSVKLLTQRNSTTYLKSIALFALAASPDERKVVYCKIYCLPGPYILLRDNFRTQHSVSKMDAPTDPEDCLVRPLIKTYIIQFHYTCIQFHTVEVINSTLKSRVPGSLPP